MGKGPNKRETQAASRKPTIAQRLRDTGSGARTAAVDPCLRPREIQISRDGAAVAVGDQIWLIAGSPPYAASQAGVIGPARGTEAKRIEACMAAGVTFTGVVQAVTASIATAVVQGR